MLSCSLWSAFRASVRLVPVIPVFCRCLLPLLGHLNFFGVCRGIRSVISYDFDELYFRCIRPSIWSVPFSLMTSIYQACKIWHSNLRLLVLSRSLLSLFVLLGGLVSFIGCCSPYLPLLVCICLSHHAVFSIPIESPRLDSICSESAELPG
jgi:hypothetical protein